RPGAALRDVAEGHRLEVRGLAAAEAVALLEARVGHVAVEPLQLDVAVRAELDELIGAGPDVADLAALLVALAGRHDADRRSRRAELVDEARGRLLERDPHHVLADRLDGVDRLHHGRAA